MSPSEACPHRPPCPGCPRFGETDLPDAARTILERLAARAKLPEPPVHRAPVHGHRHRARLAVRGTARAPAIGLFERGSHRIVDVPDCLVHHPLVNEVARVVRQAIRETGVAPYDDTTHRGALRYLQVVVERPTGRAQVVLVGRGETPEVLDALPEAVERSLGDRLQGLFFNAQPERSNTILGPRTLRLAGASATRERIGGVDVFFPPAAFGQNHLPLFDRAAERIAALVPDGLRIAEAYCGVGALGLPLLGRASEVRFNERSPDGLAGLELGLAARPASERARVRILPGAAGDQTALVDDVDVLLVDPPRRGLDEALREAIRIRPPRRLVYLACGLEALERDLDTLLADGSLRLRGLEVFDFFPWTGHVETLAWCDREPDGPESSRGAIASRTDPSPSRDGTANGMEGSRSHDEEARLGATGRRRRAPDRSRLRSAAAARA